MYTWSNTFKHTSRLFSGGKDGLFNRWSWENLIDIHMRKHEPISLASTMYKINSKWTKGLTINAKTIQLLEEIRGEKLYNIWLGDDFLYMIPKAPVTKKKKRKKIQTTSKSKTFMHQKTLSIQWNANLQNRRIYISENDLVSKIYVFLQLNENWNNTI